MLNRHPTAALLGLALLFLGANAAILTLQHPGEVATLDYDRELVFVLATAGAALVAIAAQWLLFVRGPRADRPPARHALAIVLLTGVAARLLVIWQPPLNSDDIYRYVWDARVQHAGINPYRYIPADPALAPLRDTARSPTAIYPNVNRAEYAPTIYPPAAQAVFALVGQLGATLWTMKAAMLAFDLLATAALLVMLEAAERPLVQVVTWSWNPLAIWELVNAGHVDTIAIGFTTLALLAGVLGRRGWAGTALGLAVLAKFLPAVFFPALWRPRINRRPGLQLDWRTPLAAAAVILLGYACYASAGWRVLGFLSGYADEEGIGSGSGFLLLRLLGLAGPLPHWAGTAYLVAGLLLLATLSLRIVWNPLPATAPARADVIGSGAAALAAVFIAVLSPHYPWYLAMLVIPAALTPARRGFAWTFPAWSVLWPTLAGPLLYLDFGRSRLWAAALVYLPTLPFLAIDLWSRRTARPSTPPFPAR